MKWLLKLYPQTWKRRYRSEVEAYLESELPKLRTALDLIAGAIDAWLNPDCIPETTMDKGAPTMIATSRCGAEDISVQDGLRSAAWSIGLCLVLVTAGVVLDKTLGPNILVDALLHSAFFIALTVSSRYTYLKPYSRAAQNAIIGVGIPGWYVFFLGVAALKAII